MALGFALLASAGISAGSGLLSGLLGSNASQQASKAQQQTANEAIGVQVDELGNSLTRLAPWQQTGTNAAEELGTLTGVSGAPGTSPQTAPLTAPFQPTMAQLAATPGYQFTQQQGLMATQNAEAGTQPGGAALKSGINYAEGLASTTYQQQFQNYLGQNQQIYNMLAGQSAQGANAAIGAGGLTQSSANATSNLLTGSGAASAAGTIGSASAITGGLGTASSGLTNAIGLSAVSNLFGSSGPSSNPFAGLTDAQLTGNPADA